MEEVWKEIPNSDYSISSMGRVASHKKKWGGWRVMQTPRNKKGYRTAFLSFDGVQKTYPVHRLVAEAFIGPRPTPTHQINHKNGVRDDNQAENLEWVTGSENQRHRFDVLKHPALRGEACGPSKLTEAQVREIRARLAAGEKQKRIAPDFGMDKTTISDIFRRRTWGWLRD